jgi:hypothetical protein
VMTPLWKRPTAPCANTFTKYMWYALDFS